MSGDEFQINGLCRVKGGDARFQSRTVPLNTVSADVERGGVRNVKWVRRLYAARREYEWITPPSLVVQTMSFTRAMIFLQEPP